MSENDQVFILGAGPTGLTLAAQILDNHSDIDVTIGEKRAQYTRQHVLLLQPDAFKLLPNEVKKELRSEGCAVKPPPVNKGRCWKSTSTGMWTIPTKIYETILRNYLNQWLGDGVRFVTMDGIKRTSPSRIKLPGIGTEKFDFIIGCDGSRSTIALKLLKAKKKVKHVYYGLAVLGNPINRRVYTKANKKTHQFGPQHRYRGFATKEGPYYMGVSVSKDEFDSISGKTNYADLPSEMKTVILQGLHYYNYNLVKNSITVTPVLIQNFRIIPAAKRLSDGTFVALAGDALKGPHFFGGQGINSGIREVSELAKNIKKRNLLSTYKKFCAKEYNEKHKNMKNIVIPFEEIHEIASSMSKRHLRQIAKENNVRISGLTNKYEMALVLWPHV